MRLKLGCFGIYVSAIRVYKHLIYMRRFMNYYGYIFRGVNNVYTIGVFGINILSLRKIRSHVRENNANIEEWSINMVYNDFMFVWFSYLKVKMIK